MIYTVTFNPAIDYIMDMREITVGTVNRSYNEEMYFGGKGINVSLVLNELGVESVVLGFIAGFTGKAIEQGVADCGIQTDFIELEGGNSRINVKIRSAQETAINAQGPDIEQEALDQFFEKLELLQDDDILILSGSVPASMPSDIYEKILYRISNKHVKTVVDASKELLLNVMKYRPFLVKPNHHELGELFGVEIETIEDAQKYAKKLHNMGAENVLVSMGEKGAVLIDQTSVFHTCEACKGEVKNTVGAGDSMVAGFVAGSMDGDFEYALKLGTACGSATAFSDGLAVKEVIDEMYAQFPQPEEPEDDD